MFLFKFNIIIKYKKMKKLFKKNKDVKKEENA